MVREPDHSYRHPRWLRAAAVVAAALVVVVVWSGRVVATGDEDGHGEESDEARVLVMQAIALIVNQAEQERVVERIGDAVEAPMKEGVDLAQVEAALEVAESAGGRDGLNQARILLQESIGAQPASGYGEVARIGETSEGVAPPFATGGDPGTTVVLDLIRPERGISDGGDAVLMVLSVAGLLLGLYLSRRFRPVHSVHQLRSDSAGEEART